MGTASSEQMADCLIQAFSDRFKVPAGDLNMNTLIRSLGADSLDVVDVVSVMQKRFNVKVLLTSKVNTIGDILKQMVENNK